MDETELTVMSAPPGEVGAYGLPLNVIDPYVKARLPAPAFITPVFVFVIFAVVIFAVVILSVVIVAVVIFAALAVRFSDAVTLLAFTVPVVFIFPAVRVPPTVALLLTVSPDV
jgi:hypothetical protein